MPIWGSRLQDCNQLVWCLLKANDTVLISGASASVRVGHFAVQIAKQIGAFVVSVGYPDKFEALKSLGADQVRSYYRDALAEPATVDIFFDLAATQRFASVRTLLTQKGRYISTLPEAFNVMVNPLLNRFRQQQSLFIATKANTNDLQQLYAWLEQQKNQPIIDHIFAIKDIHQAHARLLEGVTSGKCFVAVKQF